MRVADSTAVMRDSRLVVRAGGGRYAVPTERVREIVRAPALTPVPLAPAALLGLANVRGETLAVLAPSPDGLPDPMTSGQLLVIEGEKRIAIAINRVERLDRAPDHGTQNSVKIADLKLDALVSEAFPIREDARRTLVRRDASPASRPLRALVPLLRFVIAEQHFALPLEQVAEVLIVPADIARIPDADAAVVGAIAWRDATLGIFSPHVLLGLGAGRSAASRDRRIVVVALGAHRIGLLVDQVEGLLRAPPERIDPVPASLNRSESEARIAAIVRPEMEGSLVSVLAADRLLAETQTHRLMAAATVPRDEKVGAGARAAAAAFLPVRIGVHCLAFPLEAIEQTARVPPAITPVPRAPAWLTGIARVGGAPLAIIDQTLKLTGEAASGAARRLLVVRARGRRLGLLVDEALAIVRTDAALEPAPLPQALASGIFGDVLQFGGEGAVMLVIDPAALMSAAENDLLANLIRSGEAGRA